MVIGLSGASTFTVGWHATSAESARTRLAKQIANPLGQHVR